MTRHPVLVGLPASGKSTVAALLGDRFGWPVIDTDLELAARLGGSLPEAWASQPAEVIEQTQAEVCAAALRTGAVVALGSAAVLDEQIRDALAGRTVIWLQVSVTQATRRLGMNQWGMAALQAVRAQFEVQAAERFVWYEAVANATVATDRLRADEVAEQVGQLVEGCA